MLGVVFFADTKLGLSTVEYAHSVRENLGALRGIVGLPGGEVEAFAIEAGIPFVAWDRNDLAGVAGKVRALQPDIVFLAWWTDILGDEFLSLGQKYTLNMHPSFLPHSRGKDPNFWSLKEDRPFGVSIHHVVKAVDAGDVAFQRKIPVSWTDTGETLYKRSLQEMLALFKETYLFIVQGSIARRPQNLETGSFHKRAELESASAINLDDSYRARDLINLLRARTFEGHPACYFRDGGNVYEVRIKVTEDKSGR